MEQDDVRARLDAERDAALQRLADLSCDHDAIVAASRDTNADDEHDPEGATIAFERAQVDAVARLARHQLLELDAALARLAAGTYGACEACGLPISPERLDVRPAARTCIACAAARR
ncbi:MULTISPECIES: TraR/DksA family transcriptional regulator [unclassified Nocardioides]|uniref:TraR/DksA family transcriptional regulator n=1 Tax=unclassified Nocardioides TaxID=2615069 RepID=UPI000703AF25|nr:MULTISPECIES: TraR/DksA C4-type zinc finger protein [unclassified Nocardioides]KRC52869.1 DNA-binding protein [Nocardioides sp. Root79]KRC72400.1 DNA-binding protein [Nocardioides sp. Root240]